MKMSTESAFTLVELLVAIALLGFLTVLADGTVQFGNLSWRHAATRRDADADRAAIRRLLTSSITGAYPGFASAAYADRTVAFEGTSDAVQLVAPLPNALSPGVMAVERFSTGVGEESSSLMMSWRLDLPAATGGIRPNQTVRIAGSLKAIRFSYFGRVDDTQPPGWVDRWSNMSYLPDMVRIRIWRLGGTQAPWLDFTAETRTTTNVACVYDPIAPVCRRLE